MALDINTICRATNNSALSYISDILWQGLYHDSSAFEVRERAVTNECVRVDCQHATCSCHVDSVAFEI